MARYSKKEAGHGMHIRMLYHMKGIDYKDDPYDIEGEERDIYKSICLVIINELNEKEMLAGIRYELYKDKRYNLMKNEQIRPLVSKFKEKHKAVADLLGIGLKLQFKDSQIAERIFMSLMKKDIPVLGIHDSFIVQEKHKDLLYDEMIKAYQKETGGFSPIIH